MKALATLLVLSVTPLAAKAPAKSEVPAAVRADREEIGKLRRELASAMLVKKLNLSREQKRDLLAVISDAKALRAKTIAGKETDTLREERKVLLQKAIEDVRATGEVSSQTRVALEDLRDDAKDFKKDHGAEFKDLRERFTKILTTEQIEELKEMRADVPGKKQKRGKGKGMFIRLLMSEELEAELQR